MYIKGTLLILITTTSKLGWKQCLKKALKASQNKCIENTIACFKILAHEVKCINYLHHICRACKGRDLMSLSFLVTFIDFSKSSLSTFFLASFLWSFFTNIFSWKSNLMRQTCKGNSNEVGFKAKWKLQQNGQKNRPNK